MKSKFYEVDKKLIIDYLNDLFYIYCNRESGFN